MQLEMVQKLGLTPALQTSMHILQLNTLQLRSYLSETMLSNAVVDMEFPAFNATANPFHRQPRITRMENPSPDDEQTPKEQFMADKTELFSVRRDLQLQYFAMHLSEEQQYILDFMIDSLDTNGFLTESVDSIAQAVGATHEQVAHCLTLLQSMEPPGIGAANLRECLQLQLQRSAPDDTIALHIVQSHLKELAAQQYGVIAKSLQVSKTVVMRACDRIRSLNPRPLNGVSNETETAYIFPDFYVTEENGQLYAQLNDYFLPKLTLNPDYVKLLHSQLLNPSDREYMQRDYKQANEIIQFLSYRKTTLHRVVDYVLDVQKEFFLLGPGHRVSMNYHELAQALSLHESTVSRAVSGKFFECKWGVFPLRSLFLHSVGNETSSLDQILLRIRQLIASEPPGHAYSDQTLITMLEEDGLHIARRTVAKYRQQLGIPTASKRNAQAKQAAVTASPTDMRTK